LWNEQNALTDFLLGAHSQCHMVRIRTASSTTKKGGSATAMSNRRRNASSRGQRRIRVRGVQRQPIDAQKLSQALVALAQAQAEAEAQAQAERLSQPAVVEEVS
jgi:hypothetical protein